LTSATIKPPPKSDTALVVAGARISDVPEPVFLTAIPTAEVLVVVPAKATVPVFLSVTLNPFKVDLEVLNTNSDPEPAPFASEAVAVS